MSTDTPPAFELGDRTKIKMPIVWWATVTISVIVFGAGYLGMRDSVARSEVEIVELKKNKVDLAALVEVRSEISTIKAEAKDTREILIRIDENVKELKAVRRTGL